MYVKVVEVDIIHVVESPLKYYYGIFGALNLVLYQYLRKAEIVMKLLD